MGYDLDRIHATVHTLAYNHTEGTQVGNSDIFDDVSQEFHIYSIEWLPDKI